MLEKFRHRSLSRWSGFVSRHPWWVLLVAFGVAGLCIFYTLTTLTFKSNRNDLLSEDLPWNQNFIFWQDNFPGNADFVIAVDMWKDDRPDAETKTAAEEMVDELGPILAGGEWVKQVVWGYDPSKASPKAVRLLPWDQFEMQMRQVGESKLLLESKTPQHFIQGIVGQARRGGERASEMSEAEMVGGLNMVKGLVSGFAERMKMPADESLDLLQYVIPEEMAVKWEYLVTQNGRLMFIRITPKVSPGALTPFEKSIVSIRAEMDKMRVKYPQLDFGLTGIDVVETDETEAANLDSMKASIIAAVLIAILLVLSFHSFKSPLLMLLTLGVGIAWTFGFLTLTIGYLQLISVIFTVILLGLGIDFAIHITTRFELERHNYSDDEDGFAEAITSTLEKVGPGLVTGALTTAAALATTMFTDYKGVAEMGQIASAGIILCLIAMFAVYPALLRLVKSRHKHITPIDTRVVDFFKEHWVMPFVRRPVITLVLAIVIAVLAGVAISRMRFDYNLLELLPEGVPSVEWQERISRDGEQSIYFGVSIVEDLEEARKDAAAYLALPTVESVGGVGLLIPSQNARKVKEIDHVRESLEPVLSEVARGNVGNDAMANGDVNLVTQLTGLRTLLAAGMLGAPRELRGPLSELLGALNGFIANAGQLTEEERTARLAALQRDYTAWRIESAKLLQDLLDTTPLDVGDLPPAIMEPYVAHVDGVTKYALEVFPKVGEMEAAQGGPLSEAVLKPFIYQMRTVDPEVTGVIVQIYESGKLIWSSYLRAGAYALVIVFLLLWIDFKMMKDTLLCLLPVLVGFALTFGILYLVGVQINPANIIVLPLMFGIGVDAGVHIIHRYKQDKYTRPLGLSGGTGKGVSLTSYTTMIGFGSLMVSSHRGMQGLGFVMMLGIGMTLMACWIMMPTCLELRTRRREKRDEIKREHGNRYGESDEV
ncbi:MMPL family transporter [Poriferisphaera sp. WC338]|uniref:MMPL family transporter n=1 Tax=Poriferisphaera sp. WC338 TaxID=3425129 RepID=UPI003D813D74